MSFLTNNGLFWLIFSLALALIILLIIYIIKPNFQQKYISSTYVWKLSLRYKRKKIPISKLRNILIIICQVLILASCAFIIARPAIALMEEIKETEIVIVMDASASMRTENSDGMRIQRAVAEAYSDGSAVLEDGGIVSVVRCGNESEIALYRVTGTGAASVLDDALQQIVVEGCTYASTDLNGALALCEDRILSVNPKAEVYIYTDETYSYLPEGIHVTNVADETGEWNAAITDAYTRKIDGYYALFVEFMSYGRSTPMNFEITFKNPKYQGTGLDVYTQGADTYFTIGDEIVCDGDEPVTYIFMFSDTYQTTYSSIIAGTDNVVVNYEPEYTIYYYEEIEISFTDSTDDSYDLDNIYYLYGGEPQTIRILCTTEEENGNIFLPAVLATMQNAFSDEYDILITYEYATSSTVTGSREGYDFYIYEHVAPTSLPKDGVVFLFDPATAPTDAGFSISKTYENVQANYECYLYATDAAENNPVMNGITAENIYLTKASLLDDYQSEYTTLMEFTCSQGTYPALLMKDDGDSKIVVMPFSVNYSNFALRSDFPIFFYNLFSYFFPMTVTGYDFTVGERIQVNSNGESFELWRYDDALWGQESDVKLLVANALDEEDYYIVTTGEGWEGTSIFMPFYFVAEKPGRYLLRTESYFYNPDNPTTQKQTNIMIFVHADLAESDIFAYGTALSSLYRQTDTNQLYNDLILYLAIAFVAFILAEWILHMLEGI